MAGPVRTEAVVLRSLRYGEADRILHLYTVDRGRISAIAKGVRRLHSRFGGRLEPCFRVALVLHEGRSEIFTVTSAQTVVAYPQLRNHAQTLMAAGYACEAVAKLFETADPQPAAYHLLCKQLALLDQDVGHATAVGTIAFRLKLMVAAGLAPQLATCATCGERGELQGFSGAAGGVVCTACEAGSFPLCEAGYQLLVEILGQSLAVKPAPSSARALRQADRALLDTLAFHAQVRLPAACSGHLPLT